jgi:hypothetical protein
MKSGSVNIDVDVTGAEVLSLIVTDAGNGANLDWADWVEPRLARPQGEIPLTSLKWRSASTGYGQIRIGKSVVDKSLRLGGQVYSRGIGTHANSVITYLLPRGVTRFRALAGPDAGAVEQPNSETSIELFVVTGERSLLESRAALAIADPLTRALGRPNREQVVTERSTAATTLQALELTNGRTLADRLAQGADALARERGGVGAGGREGAAATSARALVDAIYERALGRRPTRTEAQLAVRLVGTPASTAGVEDLLWSVVLLPEFQLIT